MVCEGSWRGECGRGVPIPGAGGIGAGKPGPRRVRRGEFVPPAPAANCALLRRVLALPAPAHHPRDVPGHDRARRAGVAGESSAHQLAAAAESAAWPACALMWEWFHRGDQPDLRLRD